MIYIGCINQPTFGFSPYKIRKSQPSGIFSRHYACTCWGTDRTRCIGVTETHPFFCKFVNIGCFIKWASITAQIPPPHIIDKNENDIRLIQLQFTHLFQCNHRSSLFFNHVIVNRFPNLIFNPFVFEIINPRPIFESLT